MDIGEALTREQMDEYRDAPRGDEPRSVTVAMWAVVAGLVVLTALWLVWSAGQTR